MHVWLSPIRRALVSDLPILARLSLAAQFFASHLRRSPAWPLRLNGVTTYLTRDDLRRDLQTITDIFLRQEYKTDYRGATVVDLGAHKGYFGAFALTQGAARVISYEPEARNFAILQRTAAGMPWTVHQEAVASSGGSIMLYTTGRSRSHSTVRQRGGEGKEVPLVSLGSILSPLVGRIIVKINVEGAECDLIVNSHIAVWQNVEVVFVSTHHFSPCSRQDLVERLREAGFDGTVGKILTLTRR